VNETKRSKNIMKNKTEKIIGFFAVGMIALLLSCTEQPAEKEVIIVPAPSVTIEKEAPSKTTSIKLDKNGAEVQTEKVEVVIKK